MPLVIDVFSLCIWFPQQRIADALLLSKEFSFCLSLIYGEEKVKNKVQKYTPLEDKISRNLFYEVHCIVMKSGLGKQTLQATEFYYFSILSA